MKTLDVTIYQCDFCNYYKKRKYAVQQHEKLCRANPDNQHSCFSCINLEKEVKQTTEINEKDWTSKRYTNFTCRLTGNKMFSYVAKVKGIVDKYPDSFKDTIIMPNDCEYFDMAIEEYDKVKPATTLKNWIENSEKKK